jgi:hypothetical protein
MLKLYSAPRPGTTIREGLGHFSFIADNDQALINFIQAEYADHLAKSDYAYLENDGGKVIFQWGHGHA